MPGFDLAALERRIAALEANRGASLRFGAVTGVNTGDGSARVQLEDGDGMVSAPLRVLQRRSLKDKAQCLPDIGEPVACLFAGQGMEAGVVLGAHYSTQTPAPGRTASHDYTVYEDGTEIWYDRKAHKLIAKVKGDADIETEGDVSVAARGRISAESKERIALRAPFIDIFGTLNHRDYHGGASGGGTLYGDYEIRHGGLRVPDADVIARAVSLILHGHANVQNGTGVSGPPKGGSGGESGGEDIWEQLFESMRGQLLHRLTNEERLLLCLPSIAEAEAERCISPDNREGWMLLRDMFHRWFSGPGTADALNNSNVFWIAMNWVLSYTRANISYAKLTQPQYLFSPKARAALAENLRRDGLLTTKRVFFNYIEQGWTQWQKGYFQQVIVPGIYSADADGLMAALGQFTLRALARGYTEPNGVGGHLIVVQGVSVVVWDSFNFNGDYDLRYWRCEPPAFSPFEREGFSQMHNEDFQKFRRKYGYGNDFMVLSQPWDVEKFVPEAYDADL